MYDIPGGNSSVYHKHSQSQNCFLGELMGAFLYVTQSIKKECCFSLILGLTQGLNQGLWWRVEDGPPGPRLIS